MTTPSNRGRTKQRYEGCLAATQDAITIPDEEPGNVNFQVIFMTVTRPEGYIAINQTGKFHHVEARHELLLRVLRSQS